MTDRFEFSIFLLTATREELEARIDAMSEEEVRKLLKNCYRAMYELQDERTSAEK